MTDARVAASGADALYLGTPPARVAVSGADALFLGTPAARLVASGAEVLYVYGVLPPEGAALTVAEVIADLRAKRTDDVRWDEGRAFSLVYDGGPSVHDVAEQAALARRPVYVCARVRSLLALTRWR